MNPTLALVWGLVIGAIMGVGVGAFLALNSKKQQERVGKELKDALKADLYDLESGGGNNLNIPNKRPKRASVGNWRIQMAAERDESEWRARNSGRENSWKDRSSPSRSPKPSPKAPATLPKATTSVKQNNTKIQKHKNRLQDTLAKLQQIQEKQKIARMNSQKRTSVRRKGSNSDDETLRRRNTPRTSRDVTPEAIHLSE